MQSASSTHEAVTEGREGVCFGRLNTKQPERNRGIDSEQIVFLWTKQNSPGVKSTFTERFVLRWAYFSVFQSDDSLDHLSAEEKACLLFLEETIESLDTEEDSELSNDESDQLPDPANLGTKPDNQKSAAPLPLLTPPPPLPPALPIKPKEVSFKTPEVPLPRGPLSYDALVHLRNSASAKKTPLCPKIDHTIDLENHLPAPVEGPKQGSEKSNAQVPTSKTVPPVVAPKPQKIPAGVSVKTPHQAPVSSEPSYRVKHGNDPQVVRLEALHKLGLVKEQESENKTVAPLPPPKPHSFLKPPSNRLTGDPSNVQPSSPLFCHSQVLTEPKNKPLQSDAGFHHSSRSDLQSVSASVPAQPNGVKPAGLGRTAALENHTDLGHRPKPIPAPKPTSAAQALPNHASSAVGYTIMVVPGVGADRKEALKKLGLLKTWTRWAAEVCELTWSSQKSSGLLSDYRELEH